MPFLHTMKNYDPATVPRGCSWWILHAAIGSQGNPRHVQLWLLTRVAFVLHTISSSSAKRARSVVPFWRDIKFQVSIES